MLRNSREVVALTATRPLFLKDTAVVASVLARSFAHLNLRNVGWQQLHESTHPFIRSAVDIRAIEKQR